MVEFMNFGEMLESLKTGSKVARYGWNGKGMYIRLVEKTEKLNAHFEIFNSGKTFDTWVASVSDTLAEDWVIVE